MSDMEMMVRGVPLRVRADGSGPELLWAHGMLSSVAAEARLWDGVSGCRLLRYDARGHGGSGACATPHGARWDSLAHDMLGVADALGLDGWCAGGVSMGAATALCAALARPRAVTRLVLMGLPALWEARQAPARQYARIAAAGPALQARLLASTAASPLAPRDAAKAFDLATLYGGAAASDLPPPHALAAIAHIPALILAWEGDPAHPLASALALQRLLPASQLQLLPNHVDLATVREAIVAFATLRASGTP